MTNAKGAPLRQSRGRGAPARLCSSRPRRRPTQRAPPLRRRPAPPQAARPLLQALWPLCAARLFGAAPRVWRRLWPNPSASCHPAPPQGARPRSAQTRGARQRRGGGGMPWGGEKQRLRGPTI
jgi:hypothetical protein